MKTISARTILKFSPLTLVVLIIFVYILARPSYVLREQENFAPAYTRQWPLYRDVHNGVMFRYPSWLTISYDEVFTRLDHSIPYVHADFCDQVGNKPPQETLKDVAIGIIVGTGTPGAAVNKMFDEEMAKEILDNNDVPVLQPGFVDPFILGPYRGFRVRWGVEGCGQIFYVLPWNNRVIVAQIPEQGDLHDTSSEFNRYTQDLDPNPLSFEQQEQLLRDVISTMQPLK